MAFFSDLAQHFAVLREALGGEVEAELLPAAMERLSDESVVAVLVAATDLVRAGEKVRIAASGVAAARSTREAGHEGLAQKRGHRSPTSLIQEITGATKAEAAKHLRLGESLRTASGCVGSDDETTDAASDRRGERDAARDEAEPVTAATPREPWHAPLGRALLAGTIGSAQHDAILRGLGEPPSRPDDQSVGDSQVVDDIIPGAEVDGTGSGPTAETIEAWSLAGEQLIEEAQQRTVEELARTARTVRDQLDPEGAQRRFDERFTRRSFRTWTDADGLRRGSIVFDDFGGAWTQSVLDAALRPRRGGPRFVDSAEKARADALVADPRTNDQLAYDLFLEVLRAGALADAETVFGTRQAGVRVLVTRPVLDSTNAHPESDRTTRDRENDLELDHEHRDRETDSGCIGRQLPEDGARGSGVGLIEDDQRSLPGWMVGQLICDTGTVECALDHAGNPLDLGREARLYSGRQRVALTLRDGGCRWRGCDRPASYCEAHHIDEWVRDGGRTDIDRGILLCRWHHMELHHGGWRITRDGKGDFMLHPPPGRGDPVVLAPRLALRYAWADIEPPPKRFVPVV